MFRALVVRGLGFLVAQSFLLTGGKVMMPSRVKISASIVRSRIDRFCYVGPHAVIVDTHVGCYCSIGPGSVIGGMEHLTADVSTSTHLNKNIVSRRTELVADVWIGSNAFIRSGVRVGVGAVVGANSVVLDDVPDFAIVVGAPAKIIRYRFDEEKRRNIVSSTYWNEKPRMAINIIRNL